MTLRYLIAIGGNLPLGGLSGENLLQSTVAKIDAGPTSGLRRSRWYSTPAHPPGSGPDFVNGALSLESALPPEDLLAFLHDVERDFGRTRDQRWGPRTLDLDLIAAEGTVLPDSATWQYWHDLPAEKQTVETPDRLILPHPRLQDRAFVLVPLMDIAPDWVHPVLRRTIAEMHDDLTANDLAGVELLADSGCQ